MSKLNHFSASLNAANLISQTESLTVKGGIRFLTDSQQEFEQMIAKLEACGMEYSWEHGPKGYCIDW